MFGWESRYSRPESSAEAGEHWANRCLEPSRGPSLEPPSITLSGRSWGAGCGMKARTTPDERLLFPPQHLRAAGAGDDSAGRLPKKRPPRRDTRGPPRLQGSAAPRTAHATLSLCPRTRHPKQPSPQQQQRPDLSVFTVNKKKNPGRKNKPAHSRLFLYIRRQQK